jgi:hypothetical protein
MKVEESGCGLFLTFIPKHLSKVAEETYGDIRLVYPVSKPKVETRTSRIRNRNAA